MGEINETYPSAARPRSTEFQISAFKDLFGQSVVGATHWTDFKWFWPGFRDWWQDVNAYCTVQIDHIYKMIVEDSVLDRSLPRRDTKSGLLVVPETHICGGKYQVGNIYCLSGVYP
jgi:hypothetical protein